MVTPALTTVDQKGYEMGKKAAAILLDEIKSGPSNGQAKTHQINWELIIRESSQRELLVK